MKKLEIGIVTINYDEQGKLISANFNPTMQVELSQEVKEKLSKNLQQNKDSDILKFNSDYVLASFFSQMTEIELADREEKEIVSEIVKCDVYSNGKTKDCVIKYFFQERKRALAQA